MSDWIFNYGELFVVVFIWVVKWLVCIVLLGDFGVGVVVGCLDIGSDFVCYKFKFVEFDLLEDWLG